MSAKGEIIQIHIGQAGVQIANACWELYCLEHGINASGIMVHRPMDNSFLTFFSCASAKCKVVPRLVMIDSEPTVIDEIRVGAYRCLFHPDTLITGKEDSGSNFARGYNWVVTELLERSMNAIRFIAGNCKNLRGFLIFHAIGGGTGSGFCTRLMEELTNSYGSKTCILDFCVFPSPSLSSVIVEPYNAALCCHKSSEYSSVSFIVDNEALYDICSNRLGVNAPSFINLNRIIGQVVSCFTASQRFTGPALVGFDEFNTNLVPFPRVKYPLVAYSPITPLSRAEFIRPTIEQITFDCFRQGNQLVRCDPTSGKFMASVLLYRGYAVGAEINNTLNNIKQSTAVKFVDWSPTGFKVGVCNVPPSYVPGSDMASTDRAVIGLSNNTSIVTAWNRLLQKLVGLQQKNAFVYHYVGEGIEEDEFESAAEYLRDLIGDYQEMKQIGHAGG